jgi:alpha-L-fucosidase
MKVLKMNYPDYLLPVLVRFSIDAPRVISCDKGWWVLVSNCDTELSSIDPNYTVFQIKEKFGGLRYYYSPSNPIHQAKMDQVIRKYEKICAMTCEITGRHGFLLRKGQHGLGLLKTLNKDFLNEGWELADKSSKDGLDNKPMSG